MTVDVTVMHQLSHPRVRFLVGSSTSPEIREQMLAGANACGGPVMVILDSNHSAAHVAEELEAYAPLVTPGSYLLVQDGAIDLLPAFQADRPGPLPAIQNFVQRHPEF
jgi:cephalosporin hydroxylase